jgi:hypothetical protein
MTSRDFPSMETMAEVIASYSPDLDIIEAVAKARSELFDLFVESPAWDPYSLMAVIEAGAQAQVDLLVSLYSTLYGQIAELGVDAVDQERRMMGDAIRLLKTHAQIHRTIELQALLEARGEDDE